MQKLRIASNKAFVYINAFDIVYLVSHSLHSFSLLGNTKSATANLHTQSLRCILL